MRYGQILRKRWWVLVLTISLGLCGGAWFVSQLPPAYLSIGRMMVAGQIRLNESSGYSEELVNFFGTQVELMQSAEVRKRALARVQALHPELVPDRSLSWRSARCRTPRFSSCAAIGQSPTFTQAFLDACMDEYVATKKEMRSQRSESTTAAIQDELVRLEKEMQAEEEETHEFQKQNNIGFLQEEGNSAGVYLAGLNRQLADLKTEYELLNLLDVDQNLDRARNSEPERGRHGQRERQPGDVLLRPPGRLSEGHPATPDAEGRARGSFLRAAAQASHHRRAGPADHAGREAASRPSGNRASRA